MIRMQYLSMVLLPNVRSTRFWNISHPNRRVTDTEKLKTFPRAPGCYLLFHTKQAFIQRPQKLRSRSQTTASIAYS